MADLRATAVVIGAGPGGYVAAIRLGQLGVDTICVEGEHMGGVCLNVGCIPSKALITASKTAAGAEKARKMGIVLGKPKVDMEAMQGWKAGIVKKLTGGVASLLKGNKVRIVRGWATMTGPGTVEVRSEDGRLSRIGADHVVLATGSRPVEIPGFEFDGESVLDSTGGLALDALPKRLVVIGGGYIGLELGGAFGRLGSRIVVVEMMDQLLPGFDKDIVRLVERKLMSHGAEILLKHRAVGWKAKKGKKKGLVCTVESPDGEKKDLDCDKILVTVGRRPNSENLGLEGLGVALERGFVQVDQELRTNLPGLYAIGDLVGGPMLAHKAMMEGEVVAEVIAGRPAGFDQVVPAIVFTDPEVATVGLSEKEARAQGYETRVGKYPFGGLGRAMTTGETDGFVRVITDAANEAILGAQIVGPNASDLIAEATLAIEMGALAHDVGLTIHAHPTLAEAFMEATRAAVGEAIHLVNR